MHDIAEYMASKPADIGESCYLYDTFGKCGYGLACRFAKAHTTPDFTTTEKADLVKAYEGRIVVKNSLNKELQNRLRKRSVAFKKSDEYLKTLSNNKDEKGQRGNGKRRERALTDGITFFKNTLIALIVELVKMDKDMNLKFSLTVSA